MRTPYGGGAGDEGAGEEMRCKGLVNPTRQQHLDFHAWFHPQEAAWLLNTQINGILGHSGFSNEIPRTR